MEQENFNEITKQFMNFDEDMNNIIIEVILLKKEYD